MSVAKAAAFLLLSSSAALASGSADAPALRGTLGATPASVAALGVTGATVAPSAAVPTPRQRAAVERAATEDALADLAEPPAGPPLIDRLKKRETLGNVAVLHNSTELARPQYALAEGAGATRALSDGDDRVESPMVSIDVPMGLGQMNLITQEFDERGRVRDVEFLSLDTNSKWEMDVDVDDGAVFEFKRAWGGDPAKRPFQNRAKKKTVVPRS